jgi:spermidine/putrescine ABC transporter ATP-binding subunit
MNDSAAPKPIVSIQNVSKRFAGAVTAVDQVSLDIGAGEFFALLGPSGCGKTTLLRMIAGFETPTEGALLIDGQDMSQVPPNRRPVNMVFQSYAVFPHMSVFDNVAYGLKVARTKGSEIRPRVEEALELVKLGGYGARKPDQLSGGQRQRVALARALVKRPKVLLLDEPLSALDAKLREAMQMELVRLQHSVGITFIIVTHDQSEALSMANRIAVMEGGKVRQVAPPSELYERPSSRFVADFIGKINLFEAKPLGQSGAALELEVPALGRIAVPFSGDPAKVTWVAVRPEKLRLLRQPPEDGSLVFPCTVAEVAYYGETSHVLVSGPNGHGMTVNLHNGTQETPSTLAPGDSLCCSWAPEDTLLLAD